MVQFPELIHNQTESQFEMHIGDQIAFVEYFLQGNKIHLTHTEVPESLQGQGIASTLIEKTLLHIQQQHLLLIPGCSFVANYVNNHPEWRAVLSEGYQM